MPNTDAPRPAERSWWLEEALALPEFAGPEAPPLERDTTADVVILGGGYTGMWTAWFLKERQPDLDVVLLESDICGGGPSGRNGGFCDGWWEKIRDVRDTYGDADALELLMTCGRAPTEIGTWCRANGVDAWFRHGGDLAVATNDRHEGAWEGSLEAARALGVEDEYQILTAGEVQQRCASPRFGSGVLIADAATVHPARLARGLRRLLIENGVRIFERTTVTRLGMGARVTAETPNGSVRAADAVVGLGAWATWWKAFKPRLTLRGSYMVVTAPAPDRIRALGWTGGEAIRDLRSSIHYARTTPDGRIALGLGGLQPNLARRIDHRYDYEPRYARRVADDLVSDVPELRGRPDRGRLGWPDQRERVHDAVLRLARSRQRALRARVHRQRGRAVPPGRQDPRRHRPARGGWLHAARGRDAQAQAIPARTVPLAGGLPRQRGDPSQGRPRGRGTSRGRPHAGDRPAPAEARLQPRTPLTDLDAPRPARRSWWLEEALALPEFAGPDTPPLRGDTDADVLILGGGYTGMWTAWFLKQREPALDVVLLERDICGGGPSGRNGGFVNGLYDEAGPLLERHGEGGRRTIEAAARSIDEVGTWCEDAGVDAWYEPSGDLGVSTNAAHDASVRRPCRRRSVWGSPTCTGRCPRTGPRALRLAGRSRGLPGHPCRDRPPGSARAGAPAALVERGVRIFEGTPVVRFDARRPAAETPFGVVRAGRAIVALNAWARALRDFRRSLLLRGTYIVMSAPAPERLEAMRWTGGEGVYDLRTSLHYLRPTRDGRIAFGGSSYRVTGRGADSATYGYDERSASALVRDFRRWFPAFDGVPLETSWGGPIDVAGLHLPFFGTLPGGATHYGLGFTGNGVGPCHLGGRILSGLALGVRTRPRRFRSRTATGALPAGTDLLDRGTRRRRAIFRRDDRLDAGRTPGRLTDLLARLPRRLGFNLGP